MFDRIMRSPDDEGGVTTETETDENKAAEGGDERESGKPGEVRMSQDALNRLIDDRYKQAAQKVEKRIASRFGVESLDELEERMKASGKPGKGKAEGDDDKEAAIREALESARGEWQPKLERLEKERERLMGEIDRVGVQSAVIAAASKADAHDPEDVLRVLQGRLKYDTEAGRVVVLTKAGNPAIGSDGEPLTVEDAVAEVRSAKPHLFRVSTRAGAGERSGEGAQGKKTLTRSQFEALGIMEREQKIRDGFTIVDG